MQKASKSSLNLLDQWKPINFIGSGSTCDVFLVQDNKTQEKQVLKLFNSTAKSTVAESEAKLLMSLDHPRILSASGYFPKVSVPQSEDEYPLGEEVQSAPAIALEWAPNGELLELIQTFGYLPEGIARTYFLQLLNAIEYLHENGICHLDIKPDNILVDKNYNMKLADFGVAAKLPKNCFINGVVVGTALYHSPEMHLRRPYSPYQSDLFALGMTLFTMVTGNMPFNRATASDPVYNLLIEGKFDEFWDIHESIKKSSNVILSKSFRSLIQAMFAFNAKKRMSLGQIRENAWVEGSIPQEEKLVAMINSILNKPKCAEEVRAPEAPCLGDDLLEAAAC